MDLWQQKAVAAPRETARQRLFSNHAVAAAIMGAKSLAARSTSMPYVSWN
jgi:carbon monoxide dehydrogenase subunit G